MHLDAPHQVNFVTRCYKLCRVTGMKDYERTTEAHGSSSLGNGEDRQSVSWLHRTRYLLCLCATAVSRCRRLHLRKSGVVLVYYTVGRRMDGVDPISPFCRVSWHLWFCGASIPTFISFMTASFLSLTAGWFSPLSKGSYLGGSGNAKRWTARTGLPTAGDWKWHGFDDPRS